MDIWALLIGLVVVAVFGLYKRAQKKTRGTTKIIIVNGDDDVEIDTGNDAPADKASNFKRILTFLVSAAAGFAAAGAIIVNFVEPEIGPVDPTSPLAVIFYLGLTVIIYGIIRGLSRN